MKRKYRSVAALALALSLFFFHTIGFGSIGTTSPDAGIAPSATFEDGPVIPTED